MRRLAVMALAALVSACGGDGSSGGSPGTTATGYFKDSNTQGVRYVSGFQSGLTGADGRFSYEVGRPVYFYLGAGTNVPLGNIAAGQTIVTPVDLVSSGTTTSPTVQNIARFLMMLDQNNDPSDGITISSAVQAAAAHWTTPDFTLSAANFTAAMSATVAAVSTIDGRTATLPTAAQARTHLEATLRCARSGGFKGSYSGGDTGVFGVVVDAATGQVNGLGYSNSAAQVFSLTGTSAMSLDQTAGFVSGNASTGATYTGRLTSANTVAGTWTNTTASGSFSGTRVGGALNAKYRFTGQYQNSVGPLTSYGLYTFDIDGSNNVTGLAYDIPGGTTETLAGSVSGGTTLSSSPASAVTFTATINLAAGTVTAATWSKGALSGNFTASGCQLN